MTNALLWNLHPYQRNLIEQLHSHRIAAAELAAEVSAQIREDFQSVFSGTNEPRPYTPPAPFQTYEEVRASWHRAMNPTPADRAAHMLNRYEPDESSVPSWSWEWMTGQPAWLEMRRAVKRLKRDARAAYVEPGAFRQR